MQIASMVHTIVGHPLHCTPIWLTIPIAMGLCLAMAVCYVSFLYALPRSIRMLERDDPKQIMSRTGSVVVATLLSVSCLIFVAGSHRDSLECSPAVDQTIAWLGLRFGSLHHPNAWLAGLSLTIGRPLLLISLLYTGPIVTTLFLANLNTSHRVVWAGDPGFVAVPLQSLEKGGAAAAKGRSFAASLKTILQDHIQSETKYTLFRNLFVGPVFEEIVFRGCMLPLLVCAGVPMWAVVFGGPVFFGVAHLHFFLERRRAHGWQKAALATLLQFTYTYLFGVFSAFLFLRTARLQAPCLCHVFCNFWGLPNLGFLVKEGGDPLSPLFRSRYSLLAAYAAGIAAFAVSLGPLTGNSSYGSFSERWPCARLT